MNAITGKDLEFMRLALAQARKASARDEVPIGAVLVRNDQVLAQAHNFRETWQDPTAHAEMVAIREAATQTGSWRLTDTTLYVTLEPCAMCIGAVILARIPRLVFGALDPKAGASSISAALIFKTSDTESTTIPIWIEPVPTVISTTMMHVRSV